MYPVLNATAMAIERIIDMWSDNSETGELESLV